MESSILINMLRCALSEVDLMSASCGHMKNASCPNTHSAQLTVANFVECRKLRFYQLSVNISCLGFPEKADLVIAVQHIIGFCLQNRTRSIAKY